MQVITSLGTGGAERLLLDLVTMLDPSRFDVMTVVLKNDLSALDAYGFPGLAVEVADLRSSVIGGLRRFRRLIDEFDPDVMHAHMFHPLIASVAALCSIGRRQALCFTSHNATHTQFRRGMMRALRSTRAADIVFEESQHASLNARRTVVIPNGVAISSSLTARQPWRNGGTLRTLALGRLDTEKDPMGLLQAFVDANLGPLATLEFAGRGAFEERIIARIRSLAMEDRVRVLGFVKDVRALIRSCDLLIVHSKWEGMPMVLLEAGAEAMPIIATPVGSIPSILGGDRGVLTTPSDFPAALRALTASPDEAVAMGVRLREFVTRYHSIAATVHSHASLYEDVCAGRHRRISEN